MNKKYILIFLLGLVLIFSGFYYLSLNNKSDTEIINQENIIIEEENTNQQENNQSNTNTNTNTNTEKEDNKTEDKIVLDPNNKKSSCENYGGVWIDKKGICEINSYSEKQCVATGGEFNPCASSCRHDEDAEICTLQCVLTCTFR